MARILIVDDDTEFRSTLRKMLEHESHEVIDAENGDQGIAEYKANKPELLMVDIMMPGKDGVMTIQQLVAEFPHARIIAMSGGPGGNPAWLPIAKNVGAMKVLKKPFSNETLIGVVNAVINDPWRS